MAEEKFTADDFPDKGEFITPVQKRRKPDCDRKTLIPDPCDLRIDRRKKTQENNDCEISPIVQVCPEDIGKFRIPQLPEVPPFFEPQIATPVIIPPIRSIPAPNYVCNDPFTISCPSPGWVNPDWIAENYPELDFIIDSSGLPVFSDLNVTVGSLNLDPILDDPSNYINPDDLDKICGPEIVISECAFSALTREEANQKAREYAMARVDCQYCNEEITVNCEQLQEYAMVLGGEDYTTANTYVEVSGDGQGANIVPVIEDGRITGFSITSPGYDYNTMSLTLVGDGVGGAIRRVELDDDTGAVLNVHVGQVMPDPEYDPAIHPEIFTTLGSVTIPANVFLSDESQEIVDELALQTGLGSLDCMYQSPELNKDCPIGTVPKEGFDLPEGAFKIPITIDTQQSVIDRANAIIEALPCIEIPCPNGYPDVMVDINIHDPNENCETGLSDNNNTSIEGGFNSETCEFYLNGDIYLPEIPCPCGFNTEFTVNGGIVGDLEGPNGSFEFDMDNCEITMDLTLPNVNIPCPDGFITDVNVNIGGGVVCIGDDCEAPNANAVFNFDATNCAFDLGLSLELPNINIPCPEWTASITGGCMEVKPHPKQELCILVNIHSETEACIDPEGRSNTEMEAWILDGPPEGEEFEDQVGPGTNPTGKLNPHICAQAGEVLTFTIEPQVSDKFGPGEPSDRFCIGTPICDQNKFGGVWPDNQTSNDTSDCGCDESAHVAGDRVIGVEDGGLTTVFENNTEGTLDTNLQKSYREVANVKNLYRSPFTLREGGLVEFQCPEDDDFPDGVDELELLYYSDRYVSPSIEPPIPHGMVGRIHIKKSGTGGCEFHPGETDGCGGCPEEGLSNTSSQGEDSSSPTVSFDMDSCSLSIGLPDYKIELPEIPCPCGFEATSTIQGMNVSPSNSSTSSNDNECAASTPPAVVVSGNSEVSLVFDEESCTFDLDLTLPDLNIPCPDGMTIEVTGGGVTSSSEGVTINSDSDSGACATSNGCSVEIELPNINIEVDIPCPDGFTTDVTITGGVGPNEQEPDGTFIFDPEECKFDLDIDLPDIPCPDGFTTAMAIGSAGAGKPSGTLEFDAEACELQMTLALTEIPQIALDIPNIVANIPNIPCPDGYSTISNVDVIYGEPPSSNIELITDNHNCVLSLTGTITIPEPPNIPNIPCPNGYTSIDDVNIVYGPEPSSDIELNIDDKNCEISLTGTITIPEPPNIPNFPNINLDCPDGYTASGIVEVREGSGPSGTITLSKQNCEFVLNGAINIPPCNVELNCDAVRACVDTINLNCEAVQDCIDISGSIEVLAGEGYCSQAYSNVGIYSKQDGGYELAGTITLPDVCHEDPPEPPCNCDAGVDGDFDIGNGLTLSVVGGIVTGVSEA
jgi:hypothetical protein